MSTISSVSTGAAALAELYATQSTSSTTGRSTQATPPQGPPPPPPSGGGYLQTAADALEMDLDDLTEALEEGASLADIAEEQGVDVDDLKAALAAGAPEDMKSSDNFDAMIDSLIDQEGLGGPGGKMPPPGSTGVLGESMTTDQADALSTIASQLGLDADSLIAQLKSGANIADLIDASQTTTTAAAGLLISVDA